MARVSKGGWRGFIFRYVFLANDAVLFFFLIKKNRQSQNVGLAQMKTVMWCKKWLLSKCSCWQKKKKWSGIRSRTISFENTLTNMLTSRFSWNNIRPSFAPDEWRQTVFDSRARKAKVRGLPTVTSFGRIESFSPGLLQKLLRREKNKHPYSAQKKVVIASPNQLGKMKHKWNIKSSCKNKSNILHL